MVATGSPFSFSFATQVTATACGGAAHPILTHSSPGPEVFITPVRTSSATDTAATPAPLNSELVAPSLNERCTAPASTPAAATAAAMNVPGVRPSCAAAEEN